MLQRKMRNLSGALALSALCGCVLHVNRDPAPPGDFAYEPPTAALEPFTDGGAEAPEVELSAPIDTTRAHDIREFSYPSVADDGGAANVVTGRYFRSRRPGAHKLVVVMPIWGTSDYPPEKISYGYARREGADAHVIWIYGDTPLFPWTELSTAPTEAAFVELARGSAERYRAAVVDMRRLMDWAETRPEIDASRIGFVGFSMSALVTATLLGNDHRIKAAVLMMGAANLADVFSTCRNRAGEGRAHVLGSFGWTLDEYREFFAGLFDPADPMRYEGRYDPAEILMIDAMSDDCMSESARAALWEVTGYPQRVTLLYQHRSAFYSLTPLGANFARRRIYRFLDDAL
jgi:dienelactone hydrolase